MSDQPLASMTGPRGALKGQTTGAPAIRRAPSGNLVLEINRRPDHWSGEWSGDVFCLYLSPEQAIEVGAALQLAGKRPDVVPTEWTWNPGGQS